MNRVKYAARTTVSVERSRAELERELKRFGAESFAFADEPAGWTIAFHLAGRVVRMNLFRPRAAELDPPPTMKGIDAAVQQECRRRWRSLLLLIKAKLVAAADGGVTSLEREFLADLVLPSGLTVEHELLPKLTTGDEPPLLLGGHR